MPAWVRKRAPRWKAILKIAWPLIVANSFWNIQMTIDRVFLGQYSTEALGAAMAVFGVFWAPMALVQQTANYVMTFVAQYLGAKQNKKIGAAVWQSLYVSIIGGLLFLFLIPLSPYLFKQFGHSEQMQLLENQYFQAICFSALPTAIVGAASGFFTGLGLTKIIMWMNGIGMIFNIIFDYLLIFGNFGFPALGIEGAGYATAIANVFGAIFALWLVFGHANEKKYKIRSSWNWNPNLLKRFLKYGVPSGLQWALEGLAFTVFLIFVGQMENGEAALAASSIAVTVMFLSILPPLGIAQATSALVGQHLGADQPGKAEQETYAGLQVGAMYIFVIALSFVLVPEFYLSWFHNIDNPTLWVQVSEMVPILLIFIAAFTSFDCMNMIFSFTLKGAGDTKFVTAIALTVPWPLMVIPTYFVRFVDNAVYWAWGFASLFIVVQAFIFLARFLGGKWKSMRVIDVSGI